MEHNLDITVYGAVYADRVSGSLIRVAYLVSSARVVVVEKMANGKYATRINEHSEELAKIQGGIDAMFRAGPTEGRHIGLPQHRSAPTIKRLND